METLRDGKNFSRGLRGEGEEINWCRAVEAILFPFSPAHFIIAGYLWRENIGKREMYKSKETSSLLLGKGIEQV